MASLDLFIVNIAFPDIQRDFAGTSLAGALVGAQRLRDRVRRAARPRRALGRPRRAQARASSAAWRCSRWRRPPAPRRRRSACSSPRASCRPPARRCSCPTSLGAAAPRVPARAARDGRDRASGRRSAAPPRPPARSLGGLLVAGELALGVPRQRAGRHRRARRRRARRCARRATRAPSRGPTSLGAALLAGGIGALDARRSSRAPTGAGAAPRVLGALRRGRRAAARRSRAAPTRHPAPVVEPALLRVRAFAVGQRRDAAVLRRASRRCCSSNVLFLTGCWHESSCAPGCSSRPGPPMAALTAVPASLLSAPLRPARGRRARRAALRRRRRAGRAQRGRRRRTTPRTSCPACVLGGIGVGLVLPTLQGAAMATLPPALFSTGTACSRCRARSARRSASRSSSRSSARRPPGHVVEAFQPRLARASSSRPSRCRRVAMLAVGPQLRDAPSAGARCGMTGLEADAGIDRGVAPPPPIAELLGFDLVERRRGPRELRSSTRPSATTTRSAPCTAGSPRRCSTARWAARCTRRSARARLHDARAEGELRAGDHRRTPGASSRRARSSTAAGASRRRRRG